MLVAIPPTPAVGGYSGEMNTILTRTRYAEHQCALSSAPFSSPNASGKRTLRFDRAMTPSIVVAVVTNRPDLLERHALGGVGESTKAGIAALIVDQSPEGGAEALARSAGAGYLRSGQALARSESGSSLD